MGPSELLLAQAISLSGLLGATAAYAGIVRRRSALRLEFAAAAQSSRTATERVERHLTLARLEHTFTKSAFRRR